MTHPAPVEVRELARSELARVGELDRSERIEVLYEQRGTELVAKRGNFDSPNWIQDGHGEHTVHDQHRALLFHADRGGIARGAFAGDRLVGIAMVVPHIRPTIAQLAWLHVSKDFRATGVGSRLTAELEAIARQAGDVEMVVTATPSENTVRFYMRRGFRPMAEPFPDLFELEPEDIHMAKVL